MRSYPFDSLITGYDGDGNPVLDRPYNAEDLRMQVRRMFTQGVGQYPSDNMQVVSNQEMTVRVMPGFGNVNGCIFEETAERVINIESSDTLDRIDRVVVRFNNLQAVRTVDLGVLKGTPASIPVPPDLTKNADYYELALANVFIPKNSTVITQARITDLRLNEEYCGIMSATGQVGTTTLYNQYQASLEEYMEAVRSALDDTMYQQLMDQITATNTLMKSTNYAVTDAQLKAIYGTAATLKSILQDMRGVTLWSGTLSKGGSLTLNLSNYEYIEIDGVMGSGQMQTIKAKVANDIRLGAVLSTATTMYIVGINLSYSDTALKYAYSTAAQWLSGSFTTYSGSPTITKITGIK